MDNTRMEFIYGEPNGREKSLTYTIPSTLGMTVDKVVEEFSYFLRGIGFHLNGLEVIYYDN